MTELGVPPQSRPTTTADSPLRGALVGREWELNELRAGLQSASAGRGRVFLLAGDAGIGKTRLAHALTAEAESAGHHVLSSRCWEGGGAPLYWPWMQIMRAYARERGPAGLASDLGDEAVHLARMLPQLRNWMPDLPDQPSDVGDEEAQFLLFDATATFLRNVSMTRPLTLVFDDLHAADASSLIMLRFVASHVHELPVLVVGAYREPNPRPDRRVSQLLSDVAREGCTVYLRGLSRPHVAQFLADVTGVAPSTELTDAVYHATDGNPLFVSEMAHLLTSEGLLAGGELPAHLPVPAGVRQTIRRRLDALTEETRRVLATAAVLGREFDLTPLQLSCDMEPDRLLELIGEAMIHGVVAEVPGTIARYAFSHALVRDALYEQLGADVCRDLHGRVGIALETYYRANVETHLSELAYHFARAVPLQGADKAVEYGLRAGRRAVSMFAYDEAIQRYRNTLEAMDLVDPPHLDRRCDLLLAMGEAQNRAGQTGEARATFLQAAECARTLGDAERLAAAAEGYGRESLSTGLVDRALVELLEEALAALPMEDQPLRIDVMTRLALELYYSDDQQRRESLARDAVEMARRLGDPNALGRALEAAAMAGAGPDNVREQLDAGTEIIRLARETGRLEAVLNGHMWRTHAFWELGEIAAVDREVARYGELAADLKQPAHLWYAAMLRATRSLFAGQFAEAERRTAEALDIGDRARHEEAAEYFAVQRFTLLREQSRLDELAQLMPRIRELSERYPTLPAYRAVLACIHLALGDIAEAHNELERLSANDFGGITRNVAWLATLALLSEVCAEAGDRDRAAVLHRLMQPYADHNVVFDWGMAAYGSAARYLGLLSRTTGDCEAAATWFAQALEANRRMGARPCIAHTTRELAATLFLRGRGDDRARARELAAQACQSYELLGMPGYTRLARSLDDIGPTLHAAVPGRSALPPRRAASEHGAVVDPAAEQPHVFRREGDYWLIVFEGDSFRLRDAKGLRYLAALLRSAGSELHSLELAAVIEPTPAVRGPTAADAARLGLQVGPSDSDVLLDPVAKSAYRHRIAELQEEVLEAEAFNDPERAAKARTELDFISGELAAAVGLGGRDRKMSSAAERARVNVTRAVKVAVARIGEQSPSLAAHLQRTVHTGMFCSYTPDPRAPIAWDT